MAIKKGFIKTKHRRKLSDGDYQLESRWTSASTVEMANGNTVETEMTTHDTQNNITTFTNEDCETSTADGWTDIAPLTSGETHKSIFSKLGTMFRNVRYLFKELGTTDISSIGDGTVKSAISTLNSNITNKKWKFIAGGTNVTLPLDISNYDEVMFCMDFGGNPQGSIIFPTIHHYIADKNRTGHCNIGGYYAGSNNFGEFGMAKTSGSVFHAEAGWYVCNVNGTWVDGTIYLYVR